jgi:phosphoribosylformylglycinamidine synthase
LGELWGFPPALELEQEAGLQKAVVELIGAGLIDSAHDCSEGGLAIALARVAFPKGTGCSVDLKAGDIAPEFVLFGEDASRIVLSCDPANVARIKEVARKHGIFADVLGETVPETIEIKLDGRTVISARVSELNDEYEGALERALTSEPGVVAESST